MKYEKIIYSIGTVLVIGTAVMTILHTEHATTAFITVLVVMSLFQSWHVGRLKKRINELEEKNN